MGSWERIPIQKYSKENVLLVTIAGNVSVECAFFSPGFCGFSTQLETAKLSIQHCNGNES